MSARVPDFVFKKSFLQFLSSAEADELLKGCTKYAVPEGQTITRKNQKPSHIHLILDGQLQTKDSEATTTYGPGDVINFQAYLLKTDWSETTLTTKKSKIYFIPVEKFKNFFDQRPDALKTIQSWASIESIGEFTVLGESATRTLLQNRTEGVGPTPRENEDLIETDMDVAPVHEPTPTPKPPEEETPAVDPDVPPGDMAGTDYVKPDLEIYLKESSKPPVNKVYRKLIRQHDQMDCGAACMSMIAHAYGKKISLATYRGIIHVTREGASMWSLLRAGEKTGFRVLGCQTNYDGLSEIHLPAIILAEYHFMVVYSVNKMYAVVGDPGVGIRRIPRPVLERIWQGMILLLRPTNKLNEIPDSVPTFKKYLQLMTGKWKDTSEVFGAAFLSFLLGLLVPLFSQVTFDSVFVNKDIGLLNLLVIAMIVMSLITMTLGSAQTYLMTHLTHRFDATMSSLFYRHTMKLPLKFFMVRRVGDFITRFSEIAKIRQFFLGDTLQTLMNLISIFLYGAVVFLYNVKLGLLVFALSPLVFTFSFLMGRWLQRAYAEVYQDSSKAQSHVLEHFRSLQTIQALDAEIAARWRWEQVFRRLLKTRFKIGKMNIFLGSMSSGAQGLFSIGVLYYAARLNLQGELTVGQVIASGQFVAMIFGPMQALAQKWNSIQETKVAFERVDDIFTALPEGQSEDRNRDQKTTKLNGDIEFKNVWFQYGSDLSPWVVKDVNLKINTGEVVAIVGRSGSGKSTLAQMINALYQPTVGEILIDGENQKSYKLDHLRKQIGIVMQDNHIFSGSVLQNIAYGDDSPSLERALQAAKIANAYDFINSMPRGFDSILEEGGTGISGGQKQRLGIARALYRNPSVIILDEATSSLDSESEQNILSELETYCKGRTTVVIAHRLSTVKQANRIVVMDNGRVVEEGTYTNLIQPGSKFHELFGGQLEG